MHANSHTFLLLLQCDLFPRSVCLYMYYNYSYINVNLNFFYRHLGNLHSFMPHCHCLFCAGVFTFNHFKCSDMLYIHCVYLSY